LPISLNMIPWIISCCLLLYIAQLYVYLLYWYLSLSRHRILLTLFVDVRDPTSRSDPACHRTSAFIILCIVCGLLPTNMHSPITSSQELPQATYIHILQDAEADEQSIIEDSEETLRLPPESLPMTDIVSPGHKTAIVRGIALLCICWLSVGSH
jgi:hypothetical protein